MRAVWIVLVAGCSYNPNRSAPGDGAPNDIASDATVTTDTPVDTAIDGPPGGPCDFPMAADLRLCFPFDGDTQDGSSHNNDATATNHSFVAGVSGMAIVTTTSTVTVADDNSLNVSRFTIRMHIKPNALIPVGGTRQGLIENDAYRLHIMPGGGIRCAINDGTNQVDLSTFAILTTKFTRVTCSYDGSSMRVFYDGVQMGITTTNATVVNVNTLTTIGRSEPLTSGELFDGTIDNLMVFGAVVAP